jgi:hypothetical protein
MKMVKHKVLMTHPDKSRLPPEYFLFYKKAFDVIAKYYTEQQRQNQVLPREPMKYCAMRDHNRRTSSRIAEEATQKEFQKKFNQLFEENMAQKIDSTKNSWFSSEEPVFEIPSGKVTPDTMGTTFDKLKEKQSSLAIYRGVEEMTFSCGDRLYEADEDDEENARQYISSDPFSKLKFDDLRKVHKDQTVFAVSERDFQKVPQYTSVDHFMKQRNAQSLDPVDKINAEKMLLEKENQKREWAMRQQHAANLRTSQYEQKNKEIISNFLHLTQS